MQERPGPSKEPRQKWEEEELEKDVEEPSSGPNFTFNSLQREDSEADFWRHQKERYKQDAANREKQEEERRQRALDDSNERARFQQKREKMQRDLEERERAERERREADEREHREREAREREVRERESKERREREEKEREEKARREAEQRERERKEQERKAKEEQDRLDNDPRLAEERRKKDELLRRLQQMDANRDGSQPSADPFAPSDSRRGQTVGDTHPDPFAPSPSRKPGKDSDPFALSPNRKATKDIFSLSRGDSDESSPSSKKDYAFTRSVENMHQGKPAREDVSVPYIDRQKKSKAAKEDDIGGYQPSFVGTAKPGAGSQKKTLSLFDDEDSTAKTRPAPNNTDKKSKLMADLFGSQTTSSAAKKESGDGFFLTSSKSPPPASQPAQPKKSSGFPWDTPSSASKTNGSPPRESSTLFGGGAALVDNEVRGDGGPKSFMLPKRPRQTTSTFSSKPSMVAVDSVDDDIEELSL